MATIKSIEEKAKRYDEAIARSSEMIKAMTNIGGVAKVDDIQYIFPELKESEDERIRRVLREIVLQWKNGHQAWCSDDREIDTILAWLEKQCEQKPADSKIIDLDELVIELEETIGTSPHSRETIKDFFQKAVQKYMNCLRIANGEIGRLFDENYLLKEKQGEQKSVWSEEDDKMLQYAIGHFERQKRNCIEGGGRKKAMQEFIDWLKSLRPQSQWKPSEELIKVRKEVYADILSAKGFDIGTVNSELNRLEEELKKSREE